MKNKLCIFILFVTWTCFTFDMTRGALEYLNVMTYKSEIALFLGISLAILISSFGKVRTGAVKLYEKYPALFWTSIPAPFIMMLSVYRKFMES